MLIDLKNNKKSTNRQSSRRRGFHPSPLTEPNVNLSIHTALIMQSIHFKFRLIDSLTSNDKTSLDMTYTPTSTIVQL